MDKLIDALRDMLDMVNEFFPDNLDEGITVELQARIDEAQTVLDLYNDEED